VVLLLITDVCKVLFREIVKMASITGATGQFHSICRGPRVHSSNNASPDDYYYAKEAFVSLDTDKKLHVLRDGDRFKLILYTLGPDGGINGTAGVKLPAISLDAMKKTLESGILDLGDRVYRIQNMRALRKIVQ